MLPAFDKKKELSDEEVAKGAPVRGSFREQVLTDLKTVNDASMDYYTKVKAGSSAKQYKKIMEEELAWINANPELTIRQVNSRQRTYKESIQLAIADLLRETQQGIASFPPDKQVGLAQQFPIPSYRSELEKQAGDSSLKQSSEQAAEEERKRLEIENRTIWDIAQEAAVYALSWTFIVLGICLVLRIASFCANDSIYKPPAYRILNFVYGILFSPILLPYYLYREIWGWWTENDNLRPHFESLLPLVGYEPKENLTLGDRIYGFALTPDLCNWSKCKVSVETCKKQSALQSSVLQQLQALYPSKG